MRTQRRQRAAELVADDSLIDAAIAAEVGVCRRTLAYWKVQPDFVAEVSRIRRAYAASLLMGAGRLHARA